MKEIHIEADNPRYSSIKELWEYRQVSLFFFLRTLLIRTRQTALGITWNIIKPLLVIATLTLVFGKIAHLEDQGTTPYLLLVISAIIPWNFFSSSLVESSECLITNHYLIGKVYFPRLILPISALFPPCMDLVISTFLLICGMTYYAYTPSINIVYLPLFLINLFILAFGSGMLVALLNAKFRDFRQMIPFALQLGIYISPVGYTTEHLSTPWKIAYYLNPMSGIIDGFRWSLLGGQQTLFLPGIALSAVISLTIFYIGYRTFRRSEPILADII